MLLVSERKRCWSERLFTCYRYFVAQPIGHSRHGWSVRRWQLTAVPDNDSSTDSSRGDPADNERLSVNLLRYERHPVNKYWFDQRSQSSCHCEASGTDCCGGPGLLPFPRTGTGTAAASGDAVM